MPCYKVPFAGWCILKADSEEEARNIAITRLWLEDETGKAVSSSIGFGEGEYFCDDDERGADNDNGA